MTKIAGSGSGSDSRSISQRHGSADPDPHQNFMDSEHCLECIIFRRNYPFILPNRALSLESNPGLNLQQTFALKLSYATYRSYNLYVLTKTIFWGIYFQQFCTETLLECFPC
jgi:hypothetical protein